MVFSEELGYDPDEWEECPPPDHFLVFSPLARLALSIGAIGCAVLFFWLIDRNNKRAGGKKEEEKEEVHRIAPPASTPSSSGDLLSTITGFFTGRGGERAESDFVQRSFRDAEKYPAVAAAAARERLEKIDLRPDELSSSFHYDVPTTKDEVRAEVDRAAFELRDLLQDGSQQAPPPVPPHRAAFPEWSNLNAPSLEFLSTPGASEASESLRTTFDQAAATARDAYDRAAAPVADAYDCAKEAADNAYNRAAEPVSDAFDRAGQAAHGAYDRVAAPVTDAYERAKEAAENAYNRAAAPASEAYDSVAHTAQNTLSRAGQAANDAYERVAAPVADAFDRAGEPLATAQQHAAQLASAAQEGASDAYNRAAAPVADAFGRIGQTAQDSFGRATDAAQDAYDRAAAPVADADYPFGRQPAQQDRAAAPVSDAFGRVGQAAQEQLGRAADDARDAYDRAVASIADEDYPYRLGADVSMSPPRAVPQAVDRFGQAKLDTLAGAGRAAQDVYDRAVADAFERVGHPDEYERAQAADANTRLEDDFERVQRDLDNLMAEHQVPLGVIIPGSSTSTSPAVSSSRPQQQLQQTSSPIDEHVRQLTAGLLTSDSEQERKPSEIPSLHEIYEERQRQLSPPLASPVKIPTQEDRAALRHWEEELARKEQEKLSKLVDTIVGGDDISDIAASEGTEHLLPADRISMYSQDSATVQQMQPLQQEMRRGDEIEPLPASAKINQKIDQISSALEQSLLSEIEQLARQTSTMQAELARARDSEYSTDEVSEGAHDPRLDAFHPSADVRFIPAGERAEQPAQISHRNSERQSGESDDFVKITPPSHSGAPSPSPALVGMSSTEEEQLKRLVEEYDVIGYTSTLKKDASAPAALGATGSAHVAHAAHAASAAPAATSQLQMQQSLPSPTTAALLQEYESVQQPPQSPQSTRQQQKLQQKQPETHHISAEEQAQLDQVLRDFEVTPGAERRDVLGRPLPRTPPHTPENALMDSFEREGAEAGEPSTTFFTMDGDTMSPTTELRFKLAPRGSIGDLKMQFPRLPSEAGIEVVDPAHANLPKNAFLPSDLEDVLASLVAVDTQDLYLPSEEMQPPEPIVDAALADEQLYSQQPMQQVQQVQHPQQNLQQETPILVATPEPVKKESADSLFGERKPTIIRVEGPERAPAAPAAPAAPVQQLLQQAASLDLSQPLQPPMPAFDRPKQAGAAAAAVNADFVVKRQGDEDVAISGKPQMMPAFDVRIKKPSGSASATVQQEQLQKADAIFQDAIDYMHAQQQPGKEAQPHQPQATGFIMEEEMLSSHGENLPRQKSADGTSKYVKTNEVFERLDPQDDHDDMTYAPEIQSVEIPPDQLSETSELPHEDLPIDEPPLFKSPEAQKLEAEIRAQESAMEDAKSAMQHRAALAQAPHIISMSPNHPRFPSTPSISSAKDSPKALRKQSSLLSILGVTSTQEMLLKIDSLEALSNAMRKAGLDSTNVIFGIDYTASNKYQGEESFGGHSLHTIHPNLKNPYQQVITILGRTLAPFTTTGNIPVYGFGDAKTSDWSVFSLKNDGHCTSLEEVLKTYNEVTPTVELSGPTNFSPLIYQAIEICQRTREYHILVIIADGQVTNEKATRRAIVQACQYPLSIIVVGVGDGPWDMMRVFDESLPKRPWDNFHFVEFHEVCKRASGAADGDVKVAIQSLLEIPDQYRCICNLGLLKGRSPSIAHKNFENIS